MNKELVPIEKLVWRIGPCRRSVPFSECPLSTSAKMFHHLIEARNSIASKPKYFQPVSLNKEISNLEKYSKY